MLGRMHVLKEPITHGAPYMTTWGGQPFGLKKPSVPKIGNVFWAAVGFSRPHGWSPQVFIRDPPDMITCVALLAPAMLHLKASFQP